MKMLICYAIILFYAFTVRAQSTDIGATLAQIERDRTVQSTRYQEYAQEYAEAQIVRPVSGEVPADIERIYGQHDYPGGHMGECYRRGPRRWECVVFLVRAASFVLARSPLVCLGDNILTIPKLIRLASNWHEENPHLWADTTFRQQLEIILAEEYPCPKPAPPKAKRKRPVRP